MRDEFTMKLDPRDDQPGYVVAEFRVNGDGWHHYYGWPDAPPGTPYKFTPRGTTIKELVYGSLASEGLSPQPWEPREPGWGTHRIEYRGIDAAGNIGTAKAFRVTFMPSPACTSTIAAPHKGALRIESGVTCVNDTTVEGPVTVAAGASLVAQNATFTGGITATGADTIEIAGGSVQGAVRVTNTTGRVTIFGATLGDVTIAGLEDAEARARHRQHDSRRAGVYRQRGGPGARRIAEHRRQERAERGARCKLPSRGKRRTRAGLVRTRDMTFNPPLPSTAFTLPARYYTDPAIFARELDVFHRRMWIGVGRLEEIPKRGAYIVREIAGDSIIIVRASDGDEVRALANVCRHRGTRLCAEASGQLAGTIQCPYHAWTYDFDGRLIGAPHMDGSPGFDRAEFPLRRLRAGVWDGHIFVSFAADGPSLADHLGGLVEKFRPWQMADLVRGERREYDVAANWKLIVQNYNECLHCPTLHPSLNKLSHYLSGENEPLRPTYMGGRMDLNDGVETMSMDGMCRARSAAGPVGGGPPLRLLLLGVSEFHDRAAPRLRADAHALAPGLQSHPHRLRVAGASGRARQAGVRPVGCDELLGHDEPAGLARVRAGPGGIGSASYQPGPYSNREDLLYAFDRFIRGDP